MERHIDTSYQEIRDNLARMATEVEDMLSQAMSALTTRNNDDAQAVPERDHHVDDLEKQIDAQCIAIMARQQPTAADLRLLITVMRIVNDLERIGDCSKNIAQAALLLNAEPQLKPYIDLPKMAEICAAMVRWSLDAFLQDDADLARDVRSRDDEIDELYEQIFRELLTFMMEDPKTVTRSLHLLLVASDLERIADHATNIGEDVIYYLEGKDIRHTPETGSAG